MKVGRPAWVNCPRCQSAEKDKHGCCIPCKRKHNQEKYARRREEFLARSKTYNKTPRGKECAAAAQRRYNQKHSSKDKDFFRKKNAPHRFSVILNGSNRSARYSTRKPINANREELIAWLWLQPAHCKICKQHGWHPLNKAPRDVKALCVDHDQQTGELRGLLCHDCNRGISTYDKCPEATLEYLGR